MLFLSPVNDVSGEVLVVVDANAEEEEKTERWCRCQEKEGWKCWIRGYGGR